MKLITPKLLNQIKAHFQPRTILLDISQLPTALTCSSRPGSPIIRSSWRQQDLDQGLQAVLSEKVPTIIIKAFSVVRAYSETLSRQFLNANRVLSKN